MTEREALRLALEALKTYQQANKFLDVCNPAITAIKEALAQPEQEPVAFYLRDKDLATTDHEWAAEHPNDCEPCYTTPPQRTWVGLTDEEIKTLWDGVIKYAASEIRINDFARAIEAKLKEKNA